MFSQTTEDLFFLIITLQSFYIFEPDWYRRNEVRQITAIYYWAIHMLIKKAPFLRQYLIKCKHCGIIFFTDPRNAGRQDIRCSFGCRQAYKKKSSKERSKDYYQTEEGKEKKKELNKRRKKSNANNQEKDYQELEVVDEKQMNNEILNYLQLVAWHIEGKRFSLKIILMKVKILLRQHSMYMLKKRVYHCSKINKQSP